MGYTLRYILQDIFLSCYDRLLGVQAAVDAYNGKPIQKAVDTGVTVATQENSNSIK